MPFVNVRADEWGFPQDSLQVWEFDVDWDTPVNSTFTLQGALPTADFDPNVCAQMINCIPQKGTTARLDTVSDRLMFRLQYRNMGGGDGRMVVTHSVRVDRDVAGVRWYELSSVGGADWTIADQGTYAPSLTRSRWMGSAAMDREGNIAVGYSLSGAGIYPSIAIAGRLSGGPAGQLTQAERKVFAGSGSQVPDLFASGRWGTTPT